MTEKKMQTLDEAIAHAVASGLVRELMHDYAPHLRVVSACVQSGQAESLLRDYAPHVLADFPIAADPEATITHLTNANNWPFPQGGTSRFSNDGGNNA